MKNLSAANAELALMCQWWLSEEAIWDPVKQTLPMREGNAGHELIEGQIVNPLTPDEVLATISGLPAAASARVLRKFTAWCRWADNQSFADWRPEVALAFDVRSLEARELPQRIASRPWAQYEDVDRASEITIKCDVLWEGTDADGPFVEVIDWKFGRPNEKDHRQVLVGCMAAAQTAGIDRARGLVVYIGEDDVVAERREYDAFDLAAIGRRLGEVFEVVQNGRALPILGPHCRSMYCRASTSCQKFLIGKEQDK